MLDTRAFAEKIPHLYNRKRTSVYAICLHYAAKALNYFRQKQAADEFWTNQTNQARDRMFTGAIKEVDVIGWFMAHGVEYGIDLELGNNGKNEAIKPVIDNFKDDFFADIGKIYHD